MSDTYAQFEKRINSVARRHKALAAGYTAEITHDGLITLTPKPSRVYTRLQMLAVSMVAFFVLKATAIAMIGQAGYQARIDVLAAGTSFEQVGAWFLQPGAITSTLAQFLTVLTG